MKLTKFSLLFSSLALLFPMSPTLLSNKNAEKVDAYEHGVWLAIDGANEIGYIAAEQKDFFHDCSIYVEVNLDIARETNIFSTFPSSDAYINYIKTIEVLDEVKIDCPAFLFSKIPNLEEIKNIGKLDTSSANDFSYMFFESNKLKTVDFTNFDTSNAWNFREMFKGSGFENLDLKPFKTNNVSDFSYMFHDCVDLETIDVSSFDTRNAFQMDYMFSNCPKLKYLDLSNFDLSKLPRVEDMFRGTKMNVLLAPKNVLDSSYEANKLKFYLPQMSMDPDYYYDNKLNNYTAAKPSTASIKYYYSSIKDEVVAFAEQFQLAVSQLFEDGKCTDIESLRSCWETLIGYLDNWDYKYKDCFYEILKSIDNETPITSVAESMVFYNFVYNNYYGALKTKGGDFLDRCPHAEDKDGYIHIGVNTDNNVGYLASYDTYEILSSDVRWKIKIGENPYQNSVFSSNSYMDYKDIKQVIVQDEIEVIDATSFFKGLTSVTSISGVENLDTSLSQSFQSMFEDCSKLETLDASKLSAVRVTIANRMFKNCKNLYDLKMPESPSYVFTQIEEMFYGCSSLITIDLSKLDFSSVFTAMNCFYDTKFCYLLTPRKMPTFSTCNIVLYTPPLEQNYGFYDICFNTYTSIPKDKNSFLIISENAKRVMGNYCEDFRKDSEFYCKSDGSTSQASLIKLWSDQSDVFERHFVDTPHSYLLDFFKQDNSSCPYDVLKEFSERYDYIYGKYQEILDDYGGDFASRSSLINFVNNNSTNLIFSNLNQNNVIVIVVISLLTAGCLSAFYLYRRKRASN